MILYLNSFMVSSLNKRKSEKVRRDEIPLEA